MYLTNSWLRYDESPNIGYTQANDVLLEIAFNTAGTKKLMGKYAKLTKI